MGKLDDLHQAHRLVTVDQQVLHTAMCCKLGHNAAVQAQYTHAQVYVSEQ